MWCSQEKTELGLTEISRLTAINKSTVYKILLSLQNHNLVHHAPVTKKYSLDYGVLKLSSIYLKHSDLRTAAHPFIEKLADVSQKTITLALRKEDHLVFIDRVDGNNNVRFFCDIGKIAYYNSGAAAKAVFAFLPESEQKEIIKQPVYKFTTGTVSWEKLLEQAKVIRERGYFISDEEVDMGVYAIGVPIFNDHSEVVAGMAIAAVKSTLEKNEIEEMITLSKNTAKEISLRLCLHLLHKGKRPALRKEYLGFFAPAYCPVQHTAYKTHHIYGLQFLRLR